MAAISHTSGMKRTIITDTPKMATYALCTTVTLLLGVIKTALKKIFYNIQRMFLCGDSRSFGEL